MRLDKFLANTGFGTRSEVKKKIRSGQVIVNGEVIKRPECSVKKEDSIICGEDEVRYTEFVYYMLNKPAGVVSATTDRDCMTVVELIKETNHKGLFPVGRLDKDTEGLLLITNDGKLAHDLLSPARHVPKIYFVRVEGLVSMEDIQLLENGVDIGDEKPTKPAKISDVNHRNENAQTELLITITEGRYHQVKRMFQKIQKPVVYLKRIQIGALKLDDTLDYGDYRPLSSDEVQGLRVVRNKD